MNAEYNIIEKLYNVFNYPTLEKIVDKQPPSMVVLLEIKGIVPSKADLWRESQFKQLSSFIND